jgi:hypothetical protein
MLLLCEKKKEKKLFLLIETMLFYVYKKLREMTTTTTTTTMMMVMVEAAKERLDNGVVALNCSDAIITKLLKRMEEKKISCLYKGGRKSGNFFKTTFI